MVVKLYALAVVVHRIAVVVHVVLVVSRHDLIPMLILLGNCIFSQDHLGNKAWLGRSCWCGDVNPSGVLSGGRRFEFGKLSCIPFLVNYAD